MAEIEITDEASLEAWLKTRPRRDAEIIAFRAAMRTSTLFGRHMEEDWAKNESLSSISLFRDFMRFNENQRMNSSIFKMPYDFEKYIANPEEAARAMFNLVDRVESEGGHAHDIWRSVTHDVCVVEDSRALIQLPLWPTPAPDWFTAADRETRAIWDKDPATWAFWEKWWDGVISGDMLFPPELLRDVALIDDDIWQAGPKAVAAAIDKLISARALAMTDNGESVDINPDTGKLRLVGADTLPPDIDRYARRKMAKALALFDGELSNQYRPLDAPMRTIRAALDDGENLPVELFDACASASRMTAVLVETQSIPAPAQDPLIGEFVANLRETAADILAADTNTQDILTKRKAVMGNDALIAHAGDINIVVGQIVILSEGALQRKLPENAVAALNPKAHPEERNVGAYKLASWLLRVNSLIREVGGTIADYKEIVTLLAVLVARPEFQNTIAAILKYLGLG